jgi:hypothetical protein
MYGGIRTLPDVLHIPRLARNLIFVSKMDDAEVKILFEKKPAGWFEEQWCC